MDVLKSYKTASAKLNAYVQEHAMRTSQVREMVLEQVCQLRQPFTADQLVAACKPERISQGTVYNALDLFLEAKILHAADRQRGRIATEYELITGNAIRMQLECQRCGRLVEFHDKAIERLVMERKYSNFTIQHYSLFVYGECKLCRRLAKKTAP